MGLPPQPMQVAHSTVHANLINNPVNSGDGLDKSANYNYFSPETNSQSVTITSSNDANYNSSLSGLVSEYLSNGLSDALLQKYSRELTVAASSLSVLILILIGACVWCLIGLVKRGFDEKEENEEDVESTSSSPSKRKGTEGDGTDDLDSSYYASDGSAVPPKPKLKESGRKKLPIISKLFSRHNGNSSKIISHHRNIITPDKQIPFIVPTIPLPAQPPSMTRKGEDSMTYHDNPPTAPSPFVGEPQPSTSTLAQQQNQSFLMAQQFFPQLEHPEVDTCPLIAFTLFYELSSQILNVRLLEGRNFPDSVSHTVAVKIYPGRSAKQSTKEFKAKSPVYNAEFCYHVRKSSLNTKILKLRAVIPGTPKRIIGYINVALKDLPGFDQTTNEEEITEDLKTTHLWRRVELPSEIGDGVKLQVSLKWSPEPGPGLLTLKVIEASGLHENRECDYTSSYVKVTLQEQGRNIKTRKTQLVRWGSVPIFDDVFVLTIPKELLSQISFLLVVIARGRLGSKAVLGKISIGPVPFAVGALAGGGGAGVIRSSSTSSSSGTEFWEDMCHQADSEIVRWLHLVP